MKKVPNSLWVPSISKTLASPQNFTAYCVTTDQDKTAIFTGAKSLKIRVGVNREKIAKISHDPRFFSRNACLGGIQTISHFCSKSVFIGSNISSRLILHNLKISNRSLYYKQSNHISECII